MDKEISLKSYMEMDFPDGADHCVDVYDDYTDELAIAFYPKIPMTEEGLEHFAKVLDFPVIEIEDEEIVVHINNNKELRMISDFLYAQAGYCSDEDWHKWFIED